MRKYLVPSLLSANFYNLEHDISILKRNKIKYLHLDVMDGVFVPNISFGIPVIKKIKDNVNSDFILDAHLMIIEPIKYIDAFKEAGADILTVHKEATDKLLDTIKKIKEVGLLAGVSINPETDVKSIESIIPYVDLVLVMSVKPGFGGQKFIDDTLDKVSYLKEMKDKNGYKYMIEIDGGVNIENVKQILDRGVDLLVTGSAIFDGDIEKNIISFNELL